MINGHGDDAYRYGRKPVANFSSNVIPGGTNKQLLEFLQARVGEIGVYPEAGAESIQKKLAAFHSVYANQVLVTNGATEAFYLVAQAFRQKKSFIHVPSFAEYEDACKVNDHQITYDCIENLNQMNELSSDLVWLCNPNNPDGRIFSEEELLSAIETKPDTIFVLDEAYAEFIKDGQSLLNQQSFPENLIIIRSLTKKFAIPGLRLGYLVGSEAIISRIQGCKPPWTVNSLAIAAGNFIFNHYEDFKPDFQSLLNEGIWLREQIQALDGFSVVPGSATFFLIKINKGIAAELKDFLMNEHGLLIRDASNFRGLGVECFRVATQAREHNVLLIEALKAWMKF